MNIIGLEELDVSEPWIFIICPKDKKIIFDTARSTHKIVATKNSVEKYASGFISEKFFIHVFDEQGIWGDGFDLLDILRNVMPDILRKTLLENVNVSIVGLSRQERFNYPEKSKEKES